MKVPLKSCIGFELKSAIVFKWDIDEQKSTICKQLLAYKLTSCLFLCCCCEASICISPYYRRCSQKIDCLRCFLSKPWNRQCMWSAKQLINMLPPGEMVEADNGYRGEPNHIWVKDDCVSCSDRRAKRRARARHETVNKRVKQFSILTQTFRHDRSKHQAAFYLAAVIMQMMFESGERPFQCSY